MTAPVFEALLSTPQALAVFQATSVVQALLDVEAARVRARAAEGLLPLAAAQAIAGVCKAELFDVAAVVAAGRRSAGLVRPLLAQLGSTVALFDPAAATSVHGGGELQDDAVVDTAMALLTRRALALIDRDLARLVARLLAMGHDAAPLLRCQRRLHEAGVPALRLRIGGETEAVVARMAHALQLALPEEHGAAARDEAMRLHAEIGILCAMLSRLAGELLPSQPLAGALQAPQRVAALLGLLGQASGRDQVPARLAETASLYLGAHGTLASLAEALETLLPGDCARDASAPPTGTRLAALTAQAERQAHEAPWAAFLPETP